MEENFRYFVNNDCLICEDSHLLTELVEKCDSEIIRFKQKYFYLPRIFLNQRQPVHFLAGFIAASRANCPVFLCNPDWGETEWLQVLNLVKPDIIWGTEINIYNSPLPIPNYQFPVINSQLSHIMIPTGGSSGKIKFAVHTW
ncbi:MAG: hypothetical protein MJK14_20085, partial [Rivularia sp. ALOHA_DT_140]|nr:hypothetical protein [Rivularia sp. ALOHA_DT_140]